MNSHTGRELELMLQGSKPLAMFYASVNELPCEQLIPEQAFAPHVGAGLVVRQQFDFPDQSISGKCEKIRYVFFALLGEEWRIQVMRVMKAAVHSGAGWNETCERLEGMLLGYTEEENNAHCNDFFKRTVS